MREVSVQIDVEFEPLLLGHRGEAALHEVLHVDQPHFGWIDVHLAGFDLRQVEHVVDQIQQVASRRENRLRELHLLRCEIAVLVLAEQARQDEETVERRPQLVRHVGEEL